MENSSNEHSQDPEILKEFNELKRIMDEEGVPFYRASSLLRNEKDKLAIDDLSPEARDAMIGLIEEKWKNK